MDDTPLRRLHVDVKRTSDLSEHQQRLNSASTASTTGAVQPHSNCADIEQQACFGSLHDITKFTGLQRLAHRQHVV